VLKCYRQITQKALTRSVYTLHRKNYENTL